eukprot:TRINITY_DN840_c0_g3_i1.p1 TRINITY_DN840_c0_g3~~TRINITY_DN840_c0_g3_i1.p1  ORF type:complete len:834 (+),score=244.39 TRINITY_DN840_c0_g3_i1:830-3331(+)
MHYRMGNTELYFENLRKAFILDDRNPYIGYLLAEHYFYKEDITKAAKIVNKALQIYAQAPHIQQTDKKKKVEVKLDSMELKAKLLYLSGSIYHIQKDIKEAMNLYDQALQINPNMVEALFKTGQIYIQNRDFKKALETFDQILKHVPESETFETYRYLGYLYFKVKNFHEGLRYLSKARKADPNDTSVLIELSNLHESNNNFEEALTCYKDALHLFESNPSSIQPELFFNLASLHQKKGEMDEAKHFYDRTGALVTKLLQNYPEPSLNSDYLRLKVLAQGLTYNLGLWYEESARIGDAKLSFKSLIAENELYIDAYVRLANLELKRGCFQKAIDYCDQANAVLEKNKVTNELPQTFKAFIYHQMGDLQNAMAHLRKVTKLPNNVGDDPYTHLFFANLHYDILTRKRDMLTDNEQQKNALQQCKTAIDKDESCISAAINFTAVMAECGKLTEASKALKSIAETYQSETLPVMANLGHIEFLNRNYDRAIITYKKCLEMYGPDESIENPLAVCYYSTKRYHDAQKIFQRQLLRDPTNYQAIYNFAVHIQESSQATIQDPDVVDRKLKADCFERYRFTQRLYKYLNWRCAPRNHPLRQIDMQRDRDVELISQNADTRMSVVQGNEGVLLHKIQEDDRPKRQTEKTLTREERLKIMEKLQREEQTRQRMKQAEEDRKRQVAEQLAEKHQSEQEMLQMKMIQQYQDAAQQQGKKKKKKKNEDKFLANEEAVTSRGMTKIEEEEFQSEEDFYNELAEDNEGEDEDNYRPPTQKNRRGHDIYNPEDDNVHLGKRAPKGKPVEEGKKRRLKKIKDLDEEEEERAEEPEEKPYEPDGLDFSE